MCLPRHLGKYACTATERAGALLLTRAHLPFVADTGEVITLAELASDLAEVTTVTDTLAAEALAALAADGLALLGAALFLLRGPVVLLGALTHGSQPALVTAAHSTLKGPIAIVAAWAERLGRGLAGTVTVKGDLDGEAILKAHGLDSERLLLLPGAAADLGLDAEAHLDGKMTVRPKWIRGTPALEKCCAAPYRGKQNWASNPTALGSSLALILSESTE